MLREMAEHVSRDDRDEMAIPSYLHRNPAMRWMAWRRVEVVARELAALPVRPRTVIDFGCGTGVLLGECSARADRVIGIDLVLDPARMLVERWGLGNVTLATPDRADVAPGSADVIVAAEVLEHVEPLAPTLAQFHDWLAPGGVLLVSLPTENHLYRLGRRLAGFSGHYHHANARTIDPEIERAGFTRVAIAKIPLGGPASIYWVLRYTRTD
jgi:2-polyprenyl-3-methyl-5-hydroxy-6-metoxy-1,4-benzoquinol methylase